MKKSAVYKNLIIVSGTGKNVGKTTFVCKLIETFKKQNIVALKISPFWHNINNNEDILISNERFLILKESNTEGLKDSSKMLLSGATQTFYIQATDINILESFDYLTSNYIKNQPVICESSALLKYIKPSFHFIITRDIKSSVKNNSEIWVKNVNNLFDFDVNKLILLNNEWMLMNNND